ncbi:MAG: hypothetical protein KI785_15785 [Devosiaceae bacterium]|nr:hypothetical protein [Devosiaceae bacterium MH13]
MPQVIPAVAAGVGAFFSAGAPISLAAGTVGFGVAGGTAAVVGGIAVNVGLLAASTALQYALSPKSPSANFSVQAQQDYKQAVKSTIAPERLVLGTVQSSGVIFFEEDATPPYYYAGYILGTGKSEGLDSLWVNNNRVFLDGIYAASVPFFDGTNVFLAASFRDGDDDQARDQIITDNAADFANTYSADFRQRGLTTVVIKARHAGDNQTELWGSGSFLPEVQFRIKGAKIYDPRNPSHVLGDTGTYSWSDNAALCTAHYLTFPWSNRPRYIEAEYVNWDRMARAADICDRWRYKQDGTTERDFTVNGIFTSEETPANVLQNLMAAMSAIPVVYQGKWFCRPFDRRQKPIATLHDGMVVGDVSLRTERPAHEIINTVRASFISPERQYTPQETPPYVDEAAKAEDGNAIREASLSLPYTEGNERAQRLSRLAIRENRRGRALNGEVDIVARSWAIGDIITVSLVSLPEMDGNYRITRRSWIRNGTAFALTLEEWSSDIDDWRADEHAQPFTLDEDLAA